MKFDVIEVSDETIKKLKEGVDDPLTLILRLAQLSDVRVIYKENEESSIIDVVQDIVETLNKVRPKKRGFIVECYKFLDVAKEHVEDWDGGWVFYVKSEQEIIDRIVHWSSK